MAERYKTLCIYKTIQKWDENYDYVFEPVADIVNLPNAQLQDINKRIGKYGQNQYRLYLTKKANVKLSGTLFYVVDWSVQSDPYMPKGKQELIDCRITQSVTIVDINEDYRRFIEKGDVSSCLDLYKQMSESETIYQASYLFLAPESQNEFVGFWLKSDEIDIQNDSVSSTAYVAHKIKIDRSKLLKLNKMTLVNKLHFVPESTTKILTAPAKEIVAKELSRAATWSTLKNITTHSTLNNFKEILGVVSAGDFYTRLAKKLNIDENELRQDADQILEKISDLFSTDSDFGQLISTFVSQSDSVKDSLIERLKEQLLRENSAAMDEITGLEAKKKSIEEELAVLNQNLQIAQAKTKQLESEAIVYEELNKKSQEKFVEIQNDIAGYLSNVPFIQSLIKTQPYCTPQSIVAPKYYLESSKTIEDNDNVEILPSWEEFFDCLTDNVRYAGARDDSVDSLALSFYLSLFPQTSPLLILGARARQLADCFSASLCNTTADYVYLDNDISLQETLEALSVVKNPIVTLDNVILKPYFLQLVQLLKNTEKTFIYLGGLSEELKIFPKGIFSYVRPLLTDLYIDKTGDTPYGCKFEEKMDLPFLQPQRPPAWSRKILVNTNALLNMQFEVGLAKQLELDDKKINTSLILNYALPWASLDAKCDLHEKLENVESTLSDDCRDLLIRSREL